MKKFTFLPVALLATVAFAQEHNHSHYGPENPYPCLNNLESEIAFEQNPDLRIQDSIDQANFQAYYEYYYENEFDPNARSSYVIPVVVHIAHLGGEDNISDEQVYDAIEKLNWDFNNLNPDLGNTVAPFDAIIGNPDVEFRLATRDPQGNCHKGITRTYTANTVHDGGNGLRNDVIAEHGIWPQNRYMNVFVCQDPNGAAGYTNKPGNWYSATGMGGSIYMRHDYMGTIGTGSSTAKHTLAHEVGHWLNLSHCWGNNNNPGQASACSDDDGVDDTPRTIGWTSCSINGNSCSNDAVDGYWGSDVIDNVQNIMEYSYCSTMFTQGQVGVMHAALNSSTAQRNNLWTASNLAFTGTDGPGDVCEADFDSDYRVVCAGQTVTFEDVSYHNVTSRTWTFNGGSPASSTVSSPSITYDTPGVYPVSLQVSDGTNTVSTTTNDYIIVLDAPGTGMPYHEGFEFLSAIPDNENFMISNPGNDQGWSLTGTAGSGVSQKSALLQNYYISGGGTDELISGTIDLSSVDPAEAVVFTFEYAYRKKFSSNLEKLRLYVSNDCGETWALRKVIQGNALSDVTTGGSYVPSSAEEWYFVEVNNINSPYYVENFRYKFEFESDGGNNIYIDNINLYPESMADQYEIDKPNTFNVYPNPTKDLTTIEFYAEGNTAYTVTVLSALGQTIELVHNGELAQGLQQLEFDSSQLANGLYIVRIESEGKVQTKKLLKE